MTCQCGKPARYSSIQGQNVDIGWCEAGYCGTQYGAKRAAIREVELLMLKEDHYWDTHRAHMAEDVYDHLVDKSPLQRQANSLSFRTLLEWAADYPETRGQLVEAGLRLQGARNLNLRDAFRQGYDLEMALIANRLARVLSPNEA